MLRQCSLGRCIGCTIKYTCIKRMDRRESTEEKIKKKNLERGVIIEDEKEGEGCEMTKQQEKDWDALLKTLFERGWDRNPETAEMLETILDDEGKKRFKVPLAIIKHRVMRDREKGINYMV